MSDDPKLAALGQALVIGSVPAGSMEIAGSFLIAASVFGAPPEPNPTKPPRKPDADADKSTFHGERDYR